MSTPHFDGPTIAQREAAHARQLFSVAWLVAALMLALGLAAYSVSWPLFLATAGMFLFSAGWMLGAGHAGLRK